MREIIRKNRVEIFLFLILLLATFLRLWKISEIPPLWVDEIPHGVMVLDILEYGIIKNIIFPKILLGAHGGPLNLYLLIPSIYFLGSTIFSLRIVFVIFGILTILPTYYFAKKFYNKNVALLASFLLAIFPSHIYFSRIGLDYVIATFFAILALFLLHEFSKKRNKKYLYIFSIICGLGIVTRLSFVLFLVPLTILSIKFLRIKLDIKWQDLIICFILFSLCIYPLIIQNLRGYSIFLLLKDFPKTSEGANLADVGGNLARGFLVIFPKFLNWQFTDFNFTSLFLDIFMFSILILIIKFVFNIKANYNQTIKKDIFLLAIIFFTSILFSTVTITDFRPEFIMLASIYVIIIAKAFSELGTFLMRHNRYVFYLVTIIFTFLILYEIITFVIYFYLSPLSFEKITPESTLFDYVCTINVNCIANYIYKFNYSHIVVDDSNVLYFYLRWYGKIPKENIDFMLEYTGDPQLTTKKMTDKLRESLEDKNTLYILTSDNCLRFGSYDRFYKEINPKAVFLDVVNQSKKIPVLESKILSPSGYIMYEIYQAR